MAVAFLFFIVLFNVEHCPTNFCIQGLEKSMGKRRMERGRLPLINHTLERKNNSIFHTLLSGIALKIRRDISTTLVFSGSLLWVVLQLLVEVFHGCSPFKMGDHPSGGAMLVRDLSICLSPPSFPSSYSSCPPVKLPCSFLM